MGFVVYFSSISLSLAFYCRCTAAQCICVFENSPTSEECVLQSNGDQWLAQSMSREWRVDLTHTHTAVADNFWSALLSITPRHNRNKIYNTIWMKWNECVRVWIWRMNVRLPSITSSASTSSSSPPPPCETIVYNFRWQTQWTWSWSSTFVRRVICEYPLFLSFHFVPFHFSFHSSNWSLSLPSHFVMWHSIHVKPPSNCRTVDFYFRLQNVPFDACCAPFGAHAFDAQIWI